MRLFRSAVLTALFIACAFSAETSTSVICSVDQPVTSPDRVITVTAFSTDSNLEFHWSADAGEFTPPGARIVQWSPNGAAPGLHTISLRTGPQTSPVRSLTVFVSQEERSIGGVPNWRGALLAHDQSELKGYGLYSYMLLGAPPTDAERERFQAFIQTYLDRILVVKAIESETDTSQLNITYMPVEMQPAANVKVDSAWVLEHYDYRRSQAMLRKIKEKIHGNGPYIFSSTRPADAFSEARDPQLVDDLSHAPPAVIRFFVDQFLAQTSQARFTEVSTLDKVTLNLRTAIAYAALAIPEAKKAHDAAIMLFVPK